MGQLAHLVQLLESGFRTGAQEFPGSGRARAGQNLLRFLEQRAANE